NLYVSYEGNAGQKSPVLSATPLADEVLVQAGAGGDGKKAGAGGSLRDVNVFAAPGGLGADIELIAGAGGSYNVSANSKAGNGGAIISPFVLNSNVSQEAGLEGAEARTILLAGAGGSAETGKGGNGGSITSPELTGFAMDLGAGSGGAGSKKAGNGGSLQ